METLAVVLIVSLMFMVGIYVGLIAPYYITKLIMNKGNKEVDALVPTGVDENRLCKGPHTWIEAISVNEKSEYMPINVCGLCGFLPTKNLMATEEGLKRIIENNKIRDFEESVSKDFANKENEDITKFLEQDIKNGLTYDKINEIYHAGQTSNKRYIIYKIARSEELRREPKETA